ncbi:MAG: rod shape-determining protein MreD [Prevotella sp.]|nr:rod shape-determining protein MreD [Prevotella sp.]
MSIDILRKLGAFVLIVLIQATVLDHIRLFGCATPLLYVYFALLFPLSYPRWAVVVWCFAIGLSVDIFANTPGLAASSMTLMGFLQPYLFGMFIPRDADEEFKPSLHSLGFSKFFYYTTMMVLLHNLVFFSLEWFSFFDVLSWALDVLGSTVITIALILIIEHYRKR